MRRDVGDHGADCYCVHDSVEVGADCVPDLCDRTEEIYETHGDDDTEREESLVEDVNSVCGWSVEAYLPSR